MVSSSRGYKKGDMVELGITPYFASLLHVGKIEQEDDDTIIRLTAVSLSEKLRPPHAGPFDLTPPSELNLNAKFPLFPEKLPEVEAPKPSP